MTGDPSFSIPARPTRRFPRGSGVEYEGVTEILAAGPYRYGDFHDLPMPLWLVRDEDTADVFRIAVRDGTVRLHVLPETEPAGLRRFYDRLCDVDPSVSWTVDRRVDGG